MGRTISLQKISFGLFLCLSIIPIMVISVVGVTKVLKQLENIEEGYQNLLLEQHIAPLESQMTLYKELIRFVSQLPAVFELLGKGKSRPGSIEKEKAYARYAGVINRTFRKYPEIIKVRILDTLGEEFLRIHKDKNQIFHPLSKSKSKIRFDQKSFNKTITLGRVETVINPRVDLTAKKNQTYHLILELYTPIRFNEKIIGVYISEVDIGILSLAYPNIYWIFDDGSSLPEQNTISAPFEQFPGLSGIFAEGKPGMTGISPQFSWIPVFKDKNLNRTLWAGKKVLFVNSYKAKKHFLINVILSTFLTVFTISLVAYVLSNKIRWFLIDLLSWLKMEILNQNEQTLGSRTGIVEIDEFIIQLENLIHRQKEFEKEILDSAREWQTTFDAVNSVVCLIDTNNRIIKSNKTAESVFKQPLKNIINNHCRKVIYRKSKESPESISHEINAGSIRKVAEIQIDGLWFEVTTDPVLIEDGTFAKSVCILNDITERKKSEIEKEKLIEKLKKALDEIKILSGLIPICASCKKIRDDMGYWSQLEVYIEKYSEASFSHGLCPECMNKLYGGEDWYIDLTKDEKN